MQVRSILDIFDMNKEVKATSIEELAELQKQNKLWQILVFISVGITIASMVLAITPGVLVGIVAVMVTGKKSSNISKIVKKNAGNNIVVQVLDKVFDDVQYDPFGRLSSSTVDSAQFKFSYDKMSGSDHIIGKYNGLNIEMSDVDLISISHDSDGHTSEHSVFKGLWMVCDFGKNIVADVQVCERSKLGQLVNKGGIKTENEAFNKQFNIRSTNQEEAFYILTPHMMEYIIQMDEKANAKTNLSFLKNGKLHIALNCGRDAFEIKGFSSDVEKIKAQFEKEIRQITDMIDELRLTDSIFEK